MAVDKTNLRLRKHRPFSFVLGEEYIFEIGIANRMQVVRREIQISAGFFIY